jgi:hypothetical protein
MERSRTSGRGPRPWPAAPFARTHIQRETAIATRQETSQGPEGESSAAVPQIRRHVLSVLGRPEGLLRVGVYPLWDDRYRVNVLVGADAATAAAADSFFVVVDGGAIVRSTPTITRRYGISQGAL